LREVNAEKTANGKGFYKAYIKYEDFNQSQRNKIISLVVLQPD
jgi:hypothetical protein